MCPGFTAALVALTSATGAPAPPPGPGCVACAARQALPRGCVSCASPHARPRRASRTATAAADAEIPTRRPGPPARSRTPARALSRAATTTTAASAETPTTPPAPATVPDEAPLTPEELALLDALDRPDTPTTAPDLWRGLWRGPVRLRDGSPASPRTAFELDPSAIAGPVPRSVAEVLDVTPALVDVGRAFVLGDRAVLRGQTGNRVGLTLDGIPLRSALMSSHESAWNTLDPWLIERIVVAPGMDVTDIPGACAGTIALTARAPPAAPTIAAETAATGRSADRSTGLHGTAAAASSWGALRVSGGYEDFQALRVATASSARFAGGGYQREAASARARILGGAGEPVGVSAGADIERLLNVERWDLRGAVAAPPASTAAFGTNPIERVAQRALTYVAASAGKQALRGDVLLARQAFERHFDPTGAHVGEVSESATQLFARATVTWRPTVPLALTAGGTAENQQAQLAPSPTSGPLATPGDQKRLVGFAAADWTAPFASAHLAGSLVHLASAAGHDAGRRAVETTRALGEATARILVTGPLTIHAFAGTSADVPSPRDIDSAAANPGAAPLAPETALSLELGPTLAGALGWAELRAFVYRISDALEPGSGLAGLTIVHDLEIDGLELAGALRLAPRAWLTAALTWTEGRDRATGEPADAVPALSGHASARLDLGRRSFLELHLGGFSPALAIFARRTPDPLPPLLALPGSTAFLQLGLIGAADLGAGFTLRLALENALDTAQRTPESQVPRASIDLRAALAWTFEAELANPAGGSAPLAF